MRQHILPAPEELASATVSFSVQRVALHAIWCSLLEMNKQSNVNKILGSARAVRLFNWEYGIIECVRKSIQGAARSQPVQLSWIAKVMR
jgi:hypothetical protein